VPVGGDSLWPVRFESCGRSAALVKVTVQEFSFAKGEAVRRAGSMLEDIAPGERAQTDLSGDTSVASYGSTLKEANLNKKTALRFRRWHDNP